MNAMRWLGFFVCNSVTKPVVHFFPYSATASAPYPVLCNISIFANGLKKRSVALEGARLSQPDGVRLDGIFDVLTDGYPGLVGIEVELVSQQRRIDLSASQVIIELIQGRSSTRYFASPAQSAQNQDEPAAYPSMGGDATEATMVAINGSQESQTATVKRLQSADSENVPPVSLEPYTLTEFKFPNPSPSGSLLNGQVASLPQAVDSGVAAVPSSSNGAVNFFALYRDSKTKSPKAVCAL